MTENITMIVFSPAEEKEIRAAVLEDAYHGSQRSKHKGGNAAEIGALSCLQLLAMQRRLEALVSYSNAQWDSLL